MNGLDSLPITNDFASVDFFDTFFFAVAIIYSTP
jgi:hypothetical protein